MFSFLKNYELFEENEKLKILNQILFQFFFPSQNTNRNGSANCCKRYISWARSMDIADGTLPWDRK